MNNKTLLLSFGAVTAALTLPAFAVNPITEGARSLGQGTLDTSRSVLSGTADAGIGLLKAPGKALNMGDNTLPNLRAGVQEFGLSGNVDFADDINYNLNLSYGYFFKDNWQIGFTTNVQGVESDSSYGLGFFTEYNFVCESKWVPFIGLSANWVNLNSDTYNDSSAISLGLNLGVKYFIRENVALSLSVGAEYAFDDVFPGSDDFQQILRIGTRFYF